MQEDFRLIRWSLEITRLRRLILAGVQLACIGLVSAHAQADVRPERSAVEQALAKAGTNRFAMEHLLRQTPSDRLDGTRWLIAHMPERDLNTLSADFLLRDVALAYEAWHDAPWKAQVNEETFRDAVLPYASLDETREPWRERLRPLCLPIVKDATTLQEAAMALNRTLWSATGVTYSTQRRQPNQSPWESMQTGRASCSGLSILLVDACRAVGVPARVVGTPRWSNGSGNHTWVEVWDGRTWRFTGAGEATGQDLDQGWFVNNAAEANRASPLNMIYAVTWHDSPLAFPMVWHPGDRSVRALDVTDRYTQRKQALPAGSGRLLVKVVQGGQRVAMPVVVRDGAGNELCRGMSKDERFDANDHLSLVVPMGTALNVQAGEVSQSLTVTADGGLITLTVLARPWM
ncbi:MAG: transglutaminase-like domain-containing protein [Lentisphaerae bacterium]|nr:transglutaminase-like domain-containing protein [Lentisphaerota bacterium]